MNKAIKAGSDAQTTDTRVAATGHKAVAHEPAFTPPQAKPAVPRDEHHGKGGVFALIDGKRVPVDADGKPIPPRAQ